MITCKLCGVEVKDAVTHMQTKHMKIAMNALSMIAPYAASLFFEAPRIEEYERAQALLLESYEAWVPLQITKK